MKRNNKKRFLAFLLAFAMLFTQNGILTIADEAESATVTETNEAKASETQETKPTEAQTQETKPTEAQTQEAKPTEVQTQETKPTEAQTQETKPTEAQAQETKPTEAQTTETSVQEDQDTEPVQNESGADTVPGEETLPTEKDTEVQAQPTEETGNTLSSEAAESESETESEIETESETETEKAEVKGSVSQEVVQLEEDEEQVSVYVKYTITAVNLSDKAAAEDVTIAGLLSGNLTRQPDEADTDGLEIYSGAGQLPDKEGISDADLSGHASSQAVSWTKQILAPQEIKTYHFIAKVAEGITSVSELSSSWYIGGKSVDASSVIWSGTDKLQVEKKEEEKPKTSFLYEDSRVRISAVAPKSAKLPQNSELKAVYMPQGSAGYEAAVSAIKAQMGDKNTQFLDFVCYDVYFEADGVRIEPEAGSVRVNMTYKRPVLSAAENGATEYATYHIDGETNVVKDVTGSINTNAAGEVTSVGFSTDSFSPIVTVAKVTLTVNVNDRKYYKDYGLAANKSGELGYDEKNHEVSNWSTTIFRVTQYDEKGNVIGQENQYAYCLQSFVSTPGSGDYEENKNLQGALNSCPDLQRILYYGFGGPGDLSKEFFTEDNLKKIGKELGIPEEVINQFIDNIDKDEFRYILTHVVASKAYYSYDDLADTLYGDKGWYENPESVAYWGMNAEAIALANKWYEYLTSTDRKQPGTITLNGKDYSYDQDSVDTKEATSSNVFTFNGKKDNSITFIVPEHLNCVVNGTPYQSGASVTIKGGENFYFTPVSEYSETKGGVASIDWKSDTLKMSDEKDSWQAVVLYNDGSQDIGAVSYAGDDQVKLKLSINGYVGALKIVKTDEDNKPVAGAKFEVYKQKEGDGYTLTTGTDGTAYLEMRITEDIENNTVYVKEVSAPEEYIVDSTLHTVKLETAQSNPDPVEVKAVNKYKKGKLKIIKVDEKGNTIKLAGASFKLYDSKGEKIADLTTDENGVTQETDALRPGTYTVKEITAPNGYVVNTEEKSVTITAAQLGDGSQIPVIKFPFSDSAVKGKLKLTKKGEVLTNVTGPDGDKEFVYDSAMLSGAEFNLYAKEDIKAPYDQTKVLNKADSLVRSGIKTDANGEAEVTDLPLGSYYLKETVAPDGFVLSDSKIDFTVSYENQQTAVIEVSKEVNNIRQKVELSVIKKDSEDDEKTLAGAKFGLYAAQDISIGNRVVLSKDTLIGTAITDTDGIATFTQDLPLGSYYAKELTAPVGYKLSDAKVEFEVKGDGGKTETISLKPEFTDDSISVKVNKVTLKNGVETPLSGAVLTLKAAEDIKGADGNVLYPEGATITSWTSTGKDDPYDFGPYIVGGASYILEETLAPEGYVYASEIAFTVDEKGVVTVTSQDYDNDIIFVQDEQTKVEITKQFETNGEKIYELKGDEKVVFDILRAKDEKTVRSGVTITVDTNPCVVEGLPAGEYILRETYAPAGFTKAEDQRFTVSDKLSDQGTVQITEVTVKDKAIETTFSKVTLAEHKELAGASLQVLDEAGNIAVTVYGEKLEWTSDGNDKTVKGLAAGKYQMVETAAPAGYVIHENIAFEVKDDGTVTVDSNTVDKVEMTDDITKVTISKQDMTTGKELTGARLILKDSKGKTIEDWVTDGTPKEFNGKLTAGESYTLTEIYAPEGYDITDTVTFTVNEDGTVQKVVMKDELSHGSGSVKVQKLVKIDNKYTAVTYTFYTALFADEALTQRVSSVVPLEVKAAYSATASFDKLDYGTYYVAETDELGNPIKKDGVVTSNEIVNGKAVLTPQQAIANTVIINHVDLPSGYYMDGKVAVNKKVLVNGKAGHVDDTFYFALFLDEARTMMADAGVQSVTLKDASEGTVVFENIPYGKYYLSETDEKGVPVDSSYAYDVQISSEEVNLTEGASEATVTVTNCIEKETESESESKSESESQKGKSVKTGDNTPIVPFAVSFVVSALLLAALVLIFVRRRKREE